MTPYQKRIQESQRLKDRIRRLYERDQLSKAEIARKVQVSRAYVGQVLKEGK